MVLRRLAGVIHAVVDNGQRAVARAHHDRRAARKAVGIGHPACRQQRADQQRNKRQPNEKRMSKSGGDPSTHGRKRDHFTFGVNAVLRGRARHEAADRCYAALRRARMRPSAPQAAWKQKSGGRGRSAGSLGKAESNRPVAKPCDVHQAMSAATAGLTANARGAAAQHMSAMRPMRARISRVRTAAMVKNIAVACQSP